MAKERVRDPLAGEPSADYWQRRRDDGWRPVAVEWEREASAGAQGGLRVEVPYGLRAAPDGAFLVEHPDERRALELMLELIEADRPLSTVAATLNERGLPTRSGRPWTPVDVFEALPRLIETAPEIQASAAWRERRRLRAVS